MRDAPARPGIIYQATAAGREGTFGEMLDEYPEIADVPAPLVDVLTNEVMADLNRRVDVDGDDPTPLARDFVVQQDPVSER